MNRYHFTIINGKPVFIIIGQQVIHLETLGV